MTIFLPSDRGKAAVSFYTVLEELVQGQAALVQWRLGTGRTHQIRVHAKHIAHPILGDAVYGGTASGLLAFLSRGKLDG